MLYFEKLAYAKRPRKSVPGVFTSPAPPEIAPNPGKPIPGFSETEKNESTRMEDNLKINPSHNEDPMPQSEQSKPKSL